MKREQNRSSHAAMQRDELVEGLHGLGIAQYDGDLATLGNVQCLTLRAGFGFHSRHHHFFGIEAAHMVGAVIRQRLCRPARKSRAILADDERSVIFGSNRNGGEKLGNLFGRFDFHGMAPWLVCADYYVTSDYARVIYA